MDYVGMFVSNFFVVFLLGMQSKNVQQSRYFAAVMTSFGISVAQAMFVKYIAAGDIVAFLICAVGGCFGIAAAIWSHDRLIGKRQAAFGCYTAKNDREAYMPLNSGPLIDLIGNKRRDLFASKDKRLW